MRRKRTESIHNRRQTAHKPYATVHKPHATAHNSDLDHAEAGPWDVGAPKCAFHSPSPGTPGEGRDGGSDQVRDSAQTTLSTYSIAKERSRNRREPAAPRRSTAEVARQIVPKHMAN